MGSARTAAAAAAAAAERAADAEGARASELAALRATLEEEASARVAAAAAAARDAVESEWRAHLQRAVLLTREQAEAAAKAKAEASPAPPAALATPGFELKTIRTPQRYEPPEMSQLAVLDDLNQLQAALSKAAQKKAADALRNSSVGGAAATAALHNPSDHAGAESRLPPGAALAAKPAGKNGVRRTDSAVDAHLRRSLRLPSPRPVSAGAACNHSSETAAGRRGAAGGSAGLNGSGKGSSGRHQALGRSKPLARQAGDWR